MKKSYLLCLVLSMLSLSVFAETKDDWQLEKNEDGVEVYTRTTDLSAIKEVKATIKLNANPQRVLAILRNADKFTHWMAGTVHAELIESSADQQSAYIINKLPFPFKKRDAVFQYKIDDSNLDSIKVDIGLDNTKVKEDEEYERIAMAKGQWLIEKLDDDSLVTYQLLLNPGGSLPSWLVNTQVVDMPYQTLINLENELN